MKIMIEKNVFNDELGRVSNPAKIGGGSRIARSTLLLAASALALFTTRPAFAQSETYLDAVAGYSSLLLPSKGMSTNIGIGGGIGAGMHLFVSEQFFFDVGVQANYSLVILGKSQYEDVLKDIRDNDITHDTNGDGNPDGPEVFDFHYKIGGYRETVTYGTVSIPLSFNFIFGNHNQFYAGIGGRFSYPFNERYRSRIENLQTWGDYEKTHGDVLDGPEFAGFGKYGDLKGKGRLSFKSIMSATVEFGMTFPFENTGASIFAGLYGEMGVSNAWNESNDKSVIEFPAQLPAKYTPSSILASPILAPSTDGQSGEGSSLANKVAPINIGVKLKFTFNMRVGGSCQEKPKYRMRQRSIWRRY